MFLIINGVAWLAYAHDCIELTLYIPVQTPRLHFSITYSPRAEFRNLQFIKLLNCQYKVINNQIYSDGSAQIIEEIWNV